MVARHRRRRTASLGMLAMRSWTGYELTQQVRRSLRFVWPTSEGHLYREQRRLVELGWATVEEEPAGRRQRKRYTITASGRAALRSGWPPSPEEPHFQVEGILRTFLRRPRGQRRARRGDAGDRRQAGAMLDEMLGFVDEYLAEGGPLWMLEKRVGARAANGWSSAAARCTPSGCTRSPLAIDITTQLLDDARRVLHRDRGRGGRLGRPARPIAHPRHPGPARGDPRSGRPPGSRCTQPSGSGSTPPARSPRRGT